MALVDPPQEEIFILPDVTLDFANFQFIKSYLGIVGWVCEI